MPEDPHPTPPDTAPKAPPSTAARPRELAAELKPLSPAERTTFITRYLEAEQRAAKDERELKRSVDAIQIDTRRKWGILLAFWTILVVEVGLGIVSYRWPRDNCAPFVAVALGLVVLGAIDFFARPSARVYRDGMKQRWYRPYLALWCLVPFLSALAGSVWVHYQKLVEAGDDLVQLGHEIADEVERPSGPPPSCPDQTKACSPPPIAFTTWTDVTAAQVNDAVRRIVAVRATGGAPQEDEIPHFTEIARVVGHDLLVTMRPGTIDHALSLMPVRFPWFVDESAFREHTMPSFALAMGVQGLFVLWMPILLAIAVARARSRAKQTSKEAVQRLINLRDHKIMAEDAYQFIPRFCFGMLLVLGTNYVFSPFGLKATYLISITDEHALIGHTTLTLWSTSFSHAPVISVGFVGFLLYALITASKRFVQDDFDDQALLSLLVRGLVVILLSLALSGADLNEIAARTFVFIAGVFPVRALEAIANRAKMAVDPGFSDDSTPSFAGMPSLDSVKVFALRAAGIESSYDLAATDIAEVAERVRIDPRLLGRAVDRALLIDAMGLSLTDRLSMFGITSATELVDAVDAKHTVVFPPTPSAIPAAPNEASTDGVTQAMLFDAALRTANRLRNDVRVKKVRAWLATWNEDDPTEPPANL